MSDFHIGHLPIGELKPNPRNARRHSQKQLSQIAASIREFGFNSLVVVDEEGVILVGHGRVEGARMAGLQSVPVLRVAYLSPEQKIAFALADNKIALNADWEVDQLKVLWRELVGAEINFDLEVTGFETAEIDILVDGPTDAERVDRSDILPPRQAEAVSRLGDLWHLGDHRLLCGDACDPASYADLLADERARVVFTDPPYNVPIDGHVGGLGAVKHREFKMASGEMTSAEFEHFLKTVFGNLASVSVDGALHFICMDWRHMAEVIECSKRRLLRTQESLRLEQEQRRHGIALPFQARAGVRLQGRDRTASQHDRARQARTLSHERVGLCRREYLPLRPRGRTGNASDRQADRARDRRDQGLFASRRDRARRVCRVGHDHHGRA